MAQKKVESDPPSVRYCMFGPQRPGSPWKQSKVPPAIRKRYSLGLLTNFRKGRLRHHRSSLLHSPRPPGLVAVHSKWDGVPSRVGWGAGSRRSTGRWTPATRPRRNSWRPSPTCAPLGPPPPPPAARPTGIVPKTSGLGGGRRALVRQPCYSSVLQLSKFL